MPVVSNTADTPNPLGLLQLSGPYKGNLGVPTGEGKSAKWFLSIRKSAIFKRSPMTRNVLKIVGNFGAFLKN